MKLCVARWLSPHSKKVLGLNPSQDVSVWSLHVLHVSAWVYSGYSGFLPQSKNMPTGGRLIGHSKLPVDGSEDGCLSLCVSPVMNWRLVQCVPYLSVTFANNDFR